jgi:hypothetical protein
MYIYIDIIISILINLYIHICMRIMYIKKIYTYKIYKNFALLGNSFST